MGWPCHRAEAWQPAWPFGLVLPVGQAAAAAVVAAASSQAACLPVCWELCVVVLVPMQRRQRGPAASRESAALSFPKHRLPPPPRLSKVSFSPCKIDRSSLQACSQPCLVAAAAAPQRRRQRIFDRAQSLPDCQIAIRVPATTSRHHAADRPDAAWPNISARLPTRRLPAPRRRRHQAAAVVRS